MDRIVSKGERVRILLVQGSHILLSFEVQHAKKQLIMELSWMCVGLGVNSLLPCKRRRSTIVQLP